MCWIVLENSHEKTYCAAPTFVQVMPMINQLIFVCVSATPKLKKLTDVKVEEGQKVTLRCELLAGGKQTKILWSLNDKKIAKNETRRIKLKKKWAPVFLLYIFYWKEAVLFFFILWSKMLQATLGHELIDYTACWSGGKVIVLILITVCCISLGIGSYSKHLSITGTCGQI